MRRALKTSLLLFAGASLLLSGCVGGPVTLKSFPATDVVVASGRPISADACGFQLLLLLPLGVNSRLERAFEELQEKAGNDQIANLTIEENWGYGFVGTVYCTKLQAKAYQRVSSK